MPEETDGQKEVKELQTRILNLESEIKQWKKTGDESKVALDQVKKLETELVELRKERDDLKSKIWDKTERRAKERRNLPPKEKESRRADEDDDSIGGPFA